MEYRLGALHVVQDTMDKPRIDRLLQQIDPHLFCEKQLTFADEQVWCVVEDTGEQHGAERFVVVHEFRDGNGEPIVYLTEAIVDEMRKRAQAGTGNILEASKIVQRRNQERADRRRAEAAGQMDDVTRDFERHKTIGHFATVPRSQQLRMTRSRVREERAQQMRAVREGMRIAEELAKRGARATLVQR